MKRLYLLAVFCGLLFVPGSVMAQLSIDEVNAQNEELTFKDEVKKQSSVDTEFFNLAKYRAERAAIRKERNYLEFGAALMGTLTSYNDSWIETSGGDNSIATIATAYLNHLFKKNTFSVETVFNAKFGYNRMKVETTDADGNTTSDGVWFKNQDEFQISVAPSFSVSKNWSYGAIVKFRSQFTNGYKSRTEQKDEHRKSRFMTPGYLDLSFGMTYKCPSAKFPIVINLSPIAMSGTFVENRMIRENGYLYGLEDPDKTSKYEGGSSIQINFDRKFLKEVLRYRTTLFSFYGWISDIGQANKMKKYSAFRDAFAEWSANGGGDVKTKPVLAIHPTVRWENTLEIKATKFLTTTLNFQLYYNRAQNLDVQTQTLLSVGLAYTFKNKEKK